MFELLGMLEEWKGCYQDISEFDEDRLLDDKAAG